MSIPLLDYSPSSQNQRVAGYDVGTEETPRLYRLEDCSDLGDIAQLIWAAYRQVFSEHVLLQTSRQPHLESQLRNRAISVRDFVRGLAKSETFRRLVVETNSNYRIVELSLKRLLGRAPYGKDEELAWSIQIATEGWQGFVDTLIDSHEYSENFGDSTVPYQRRRYKDRPFNLVTPRYGAYWRDKLEDSRYKWGDINNFLAMARTVTIVPVPFTSVQTDSIQIPDTSRAEGSEVPASINPTAAFPLI